MPVPREVSLHLDDFLKAKDMDNHEYFKQRRLVFDELSPWARTYAMHVAQDEISTIAHFNASEFFGPSRGQRKAYVRGLNANLSSLAPEERHFRDYGLLSFNSLFEAMQHVRTPEFRQVILDLEKPPEDGDEEKRRMLAFSSSKVFVPLIARARILEDFLSLHPADLPEKDKIEFLMRRLPSRFVDHPLISGVLAAEEKLEGVFEELHASEQERAAAVGRYYRSSHKDAVLDSIRAWLERKRSGLEEENGPSNPQFEQPTESVPSAEEMLERALSAKFKLTTSSSKSAALKPFRKLVKKRGVPLGEVLDAINSHEGNDPLALAEALHKQAGEGLYQKKNGGGLNGPQAEVQPPRPVEEPQSSEETPGEFLARLDSTSRVTAEDKVRLQSLIRWSGLSDEQLDVALEHLILKLMYASKHKIKRVNIPDYFLWDAIQHRGQKVVDRLVGEGKIVRKQGTKPPGVGDYVVLSKSLFSKYGGKA